jgi:7-cyano-7-deazaguanine synthase
MIKAVVLLSGGLDSSYNLFRAAREFEISLALTFHYGQKAAPKEIATAQKLSRKLKIPHRVVELPWFRDFTNTKLVAAGEVPKGHEVSIDDLEKSMETMRAVWVPNRNGILLNIGAAYAEGLNAKYLIPGFNAEEATTFPDNSQAYLESLNQAFHFSTANHVEVKCFSTGLNKTEIVREAIKLEVPLADLWPCYNAAEEWCGTCESCQRFDRAIRAAGVQL